MPAMHDESIKRTVFYPGYGGNFDTKFPDYKQDCFLSGSYRKIKIKRGFSKAPLVFSRPGRVLMHGSG